MQIQRPATNIIGLLTLLALTTSTAHSGEELMPLAPGLQRVSSDDSDKPTLRKNDVKLSLPTPTRRMPVDNDGFFKFDPNEVLLPPPLPSETEETETPTFDQQKPVAAAKAALRSQPSAAKTLSRTLSGEKNSVFLGEVPGVVTPQQLAALLKDEERYIAFGKPVDVVLDMAAVGFPEWLFGPGPLRKTTPATPESVMAMAGSNLPPMPAPPLADTQVATLEPFRLPAEPAPAQPQPLSVPDPIMATSTVFHSMPPPPPASPADSQPAWTPPPQNNTQSDNDTPSSGPLLLRIPPQMSQAASGPPPVGTLAAGNGTVSLEPAPRQATYTRPSDSGSKGSSAASVPAALSPREFAAPDDIGYYDQPRAQRYDTRETGRNAPPAKKRPANNPQQTGKKRTSKESQSTRGNRNLDGFVPLRSAGNVIGPPDPKMFSSR